MRAISRSAVLLSGLLVLAGDTRAGCRDDGPAGGCGLELKVSIDDQVCAPGDSLVFRIALVNRGTDPVYLPSSFFTFGLLPCTVLPSGKADYFKATFPAPECDRLPGAGDVVLAVGEMVELEKTCIAGREEGVQAWSFAAALYKCPAIAYSISCELASNAVELLVQPAR